MNRSTDWEKAIHKWSPMEHAVEGRINIFTIVLRQAVELKAAPWRRTPNLH